jgi:hypothetical protein
MAGDLGDAGEEERLVRKEQVMKKGQVVMMTRGRSGRIG